MATENKYTQYQYVIAYLQQQVQRGIKQKDLAEALGKSNTFINYIVKDKRKNKYLKPEIIEKIAGYFELSIDQLLMAGKAIHLKNNPEIQKTEKSRKDNKITQIHLHIHINGAADQVVRI